MSRLLDISNEYFEWMCDLVYDSKYTNRLSYRELLSYLHNRKFDYFIALDGNRAEDGVDLRYRFAREKGYSDPAIATYLDYKPCSILEMMVALVIRCEEHIMDDPDIGNRTGQWFWGMIFNLGLESMDDSNFDINRVCGVIDRFINREYEPNGEGGLFTVENCEYDLRTVEIWYQMCWYLDCI